MSLITAPTTPALHEPTLALHEPEEALIILRSVLYAYVNALSHIQRDKQRSLPVIEGAKK